MCVPNFQAIHLDWSHGLTKRLKLSSWKLLLAWIKKIRTGRFTEIIGKPCHRYSGYPWVLAVNLLGHLWLQLRCKLATFGCSVDYTVMPFVWWLLHSTVLGTCCCFWCVCLCYHSCRIWFLCSLLMVVAILFWEWHPLWVLGFYVDLF